MHELLSSCTVDISTLNVEMNSTVQKKRFVGKMTSLIWVAPEYSLGAYGWWHHPSKNTTAPVANELVSNLALHQMILSLVWLHNQIAAFGGNVQDITLAGNSSGATLVHYLHLVLTPEVMKFSGLPTHAFYKMVMMSCSAYLAPIRQQPEALDLQHRILTATGYTGQEDDMRTVVEFMNQIPSKTLRAIVAKETLIWIIDPTLARLQQARDNFLNRS